MAFDLVVRNGVVVDGSGLGSFRADVGVVNGVIAAVGRGRIVTKRRRLRRRRRVTKSDARNQLRQAGGTYFWFNVLPALQTHSMLPACVIGEKIR